MVEIKTKEKKIIQVEKYPDGLDNIDKTIWDILAREQKSMSVNTLRNKIRDEMIGNLYQFIERLQKLSQISKKSGYEGIDLWNENKETLQIGKKKEKENATPNLS